MESLTATLLPIVQTINGYLADYVLVIMLVATGIYFTVKTRFIQVRYFGEGMKNIFGNMSLHGEKQASGMSSFQAVATAIAAQVGTGNIVGASGAILTGGPGAIFWMCVCMHNVPEDKIFRPAVWGAFGMDKEGQDYRACATYGALYKKN